MRYKTIESDEALLEKPHAQEKEVSAAFDLVVNFLRTAGYARTLDVLQHEASIDTRTRCSRTSRELAERVGVPMDPWSKQSVLQHMLDGSGCNTKSTMGAAIAASGSSVNATRRDASSSKMRGAFIAEGMHAGAAPDLPSRGDVVMDTSFASKSGAKTSGSMPGPSLQGVGVFSGGADKRDSGFRAGLLGDLPPLGSTDGRDSTTFDQMKSVGGSVSDSHVMKLFDGSASNSKSSSSESSVTGGATTLIGATSRGRVSHFDEEVEVPSEVHDESISAAGESSPQSDFMGHSLGGNSLGDSGHGKMLRSSVDSLTMRSSIGYGDAPDFSVDSQELEAYDHFEEVDIQRR